MFPTLGLLIPGSGGVFTRGKLEAWMTWSTTKCLNRTQEPGPELPVIPRVTQDLVEQR